MRDEVSTTCVSRWVRKATMWAELWTHPLTQVVLTQICPYCFAIVGAEV